MSVKVSILLKCLLIFLCTLSIISSICKAPFEDYTKNYGHPSEEYDPSFFFKFQSIGDVINAADNKFKPGERSSVEYFDYVAEIIRKRFYHGYSYYNLSENPIAVIGGQFTAGHLSAIVIPDDIMKHPMAACSQQAIVLMDIFKRNHIDFRRVGFLHHYTVEANIQGHWRYFDTDLEPKFQNKPESLSELIMSGKFYEG